MRKLVMLLGLCGLFATAMPANAMSFYQDLNDGAIIVEVDSCNDLTRLADVLDDDPTGKTDDDPPTPPQPSPDPQPTTPSTAPATIPTFHEQDFVIAQEKLTAFVRDVNWKTGLYLTLRDATFFQRLKIVCTGVNNATQSLRLKLQKYDPDIDTHVQKLEDDAIESLEQATTNATFNHLAELSLRGIYEAIITDKPFLLLLISEETYRSLVKLDPRIQDLADNMYKFFAYRAVYMDDSYNVNTKPLIKISRIVKWDSIDLWQLMADFAEQMYSFAQNNQLSPDSERRLHIWRLNAALEQVKHKTKVEARAAKIALEDPNNRQWIESLNNNNPRKKSLDREARALLKKLSPDEIKNLISKYYGK